MSGRGYAHDALPLLAGWFATALLLRAYRRRSWRTLLATWAVGIPVGVALRALVLGRAWNGKQLAFLATTLVFTLVFGLVLRLAASAGSAARRRSP